MKSDFIKEVEQYMADNYKEDKRTKADKLLSCLKYKFKQVANVSVDTNKKELKATINGNNNIIITYNDIKYDISLSLEEWLSLCEIRRNISLYV